MNRKLFPRAQPASEANFFFQSNLAGGKVDIGRDDRAHAENLTMAWFWRSLRPLQRTTCTHYQRCLQPFGPGWLFYPAPGFLVVGDTVPFHPENTMNPIRTSGMIAGSFVALLSAMFSGGVIAAPTQTPLSQTTISGYVDTSAQYNPNPGGGTASQPYYSGTAAGKSVAEHTSVQHDAGDICAGPFIPTPWRGQPLHHRCRRLCHAQLAVPAAMPPATAKSWESITLIDWCGMLAPC